MTFAEITWTQLGEISGGIALLGGFILALYLATRSTPVKIDQDPAPEFRKAPKRYNHDLAEARYHELKDGLGSHDAEIDRLWTEMRKEDTTIRETHARNFADVKNELGAASSQLAEINKNVRLLLGEKFK